jgi:hypothetical protein
MLQRLMGELVREEACVAERRVESSREAALGAAEEAKRLREERKREALERSRLRQSDPNYFTKKKGNDSAGAVGTVAIEAVPSADVSSPSAEKQGADGSRISDGSNSECGADSNQTDDTSDPNFDPFRSYKSNSRPKVYVK